MPAQRARLAGLAGGHGADAGGGRRATAAAQLVPQQARGRGHVADERAQEDLALRQPPLCARAQAQRSAGQPPLLAYTLRLVLLWA